MILSALATRWLHAPKWLPDPLIVISPANAIYQGRYHHPKRGERLLAGHYYDSTHGIIELTERSSAADLAHEFRHHWQGHVLDDEHFDSVNWEPWRGYKEASVRYFTRSRVENDALHYEWKKYPTEGVQQWLEWIGWRRYSGLPGLSRSL